MLKRIAAEKAKLVAEGKIKKSKPLAEITDDEKPFELPVGWEWVFLPDVSEYKVGKTPSTKSSVYWTNSGDGFNWVSIADLNHDGSVFETTKQITDKAVSEVFRYEPAPVGTILMSFKLTLGKISTLEVPAFHNEAIISIYPNQSIFKDYLFKVLPARAMAGNSKSAIKGNTLNSESIAALMIPLPPIAEQHRIVAKVDELMALCDQLENQHNNAAVAHEKLVSYLLGTLTQSQNAEDFNSNWQRISEHFDTLFTTEASIDALKQTLLQLAVMGKLVPQDPNDEPASELLKRIAAEKAKLVAEGKIKKSKPLAEITDDEKPFELPTGWAHAQLADLVNVLNGRAYKKEELLNEGTPVLRVGNLFTSEHWYYSNLILEEDKYCNKGDLLFVWSASFGPFIWDGDKAIYHYHIWKLNMYGGDDLLYKRYLYTFLVEQTQKIKASGHGVMMIHMTKEKMEKLNIVLPPIAEQHRIVAKVDELMALCDQLKSRLTAANQLQQKLADVIIEQAINQS